MLISYDCWSLHLVKISWYAKIIKYFKDIKYKQFKWQVTKYKQLYITSKIRNGQLKTKKMFVYSIIIKIKLEIFVFS